MDIKNINKSNTWNLGLNVKYKNEIKPKQIEENIEEKNIEQTNEEINTKMKEHYIFSKKILNIKILLNIIN